MRHRLVIVPALCLLVAAACGEKQQSASEEAPDPHQPALASMSASDIRPPPPGAGTGGTALSWDVPTGWQSETPSTAMRKAQYRIPGEAGDAQCIVFYFGPGQGGSAMANAQRWANEFTLPDGSPGNTGMQVEDRRVGEIDVLIVAVSGTYQGGFGMQEAPKPDQMLLGAVATGPDANWFFKLTGPKATVEAQRQAFDALIGSLNRGEGAP